jgi:hypothetical protein
MTDEAEVSTRCAGCGELPRLRNGYIVHMRSCPTLSEVEPGSVPLPTPTPPEDRQALRDRIAEALLAGDVSEMDVPDSEEEFWGLVTDIAVMPVVDELREKADRANRLLTRLIEEQQHRDPDVRARIRAAIEQAYEGVDGVVVNPLDAATDAVGAEVFPHLKSLGVALEDRDKILAEVSGELASTREERRAYWELLKTQTGRMRRWKRRADQAVDDGIRNAAKGINERSRLRAELRTTREELTPALSPELIAEVRAVAAWNTEQSLRTEPREFGPLTEAPAVSLLPEEAKPE